MAAVVDKSGNEMSERTIWKVTLHTKLGLPLGKLLDEPHD